MTPQKQRVLFVLGVASGGTVRHVCALAEALTSQGYDVVTAAPDGTLPSGAAAFSRVVSVQIGAVPQPWRAVGVIRALVALTKSANVVHAHGVRAGAFAVLAARFTRQRRPVIVTMHNGPQGSRAAHAIYAVLEWIVARGADVVLGVSEDLCQRARLCGAKDVRVAVVAAPRPSQVKGTAEDITQITRQHLKADGPLVLCIARLAHQKGLPMLLDVASKLRDLPNLVIAVAGDGPLRTTLDQRIAQECLPVRLLGWRNDIPELLAAADVMVSTAAWEGQPVGIQQALQAGVPVVATDVGGTRAVTGDAAALVPFGEVDAFADAIRMLLADPIRLAHWAARARARGAQLPDDAMAVAAVLLVYDQVSRTE
ncbi:MAG: glycosyltransferase [Actinomycetota bacterium]